MAKTYKDSKTHKDVRQDLANALIEHIEQGTAPWQRQWDPSLGDDTPVNAVTDKRYRGINQFWLGLNQPDSDPRWCTFNQAREKGWQIHKGSHGVQIEKWMVVDKSTDSEIDGEAAKAKEKRLTVRFYTVFHASQIEGIPELVPQERTDTPLEPDERVAKVVEQMGVSLHLGGSRAFYRPSLDAISLPAIETFATAADFDSVLLHEIGHATGSKNRLDRDLSSTFGSPGYAKEELRAEISAAMSARVLGIAFDPAQVDKTERSGIDNSASYLKSWLAALPEQDRKPELMAAITSAQKISDYVLGFALGFSETIETEVESEITSESKPSVLLTAGRKIKL